MTLTLETNVDERRAEYAALKELRRSFPRVPQRRFAKAVYDYNPVLLDAAEEDDHARRLLRAADEALNSEATLYSRVRRADAELFGKDNRGGQATARPRLKVGDRVEIVENGKKYDDSPGYANTWVSDMDDTVGAIRTIDRIDVCGVYFVEDGECGYGYPPQVLRRV